MTIPMTQAEFITRADKLWSGKFDYSLVEYKGLLHKITLICPVHGKFSQKAAGHLDGKDCAKCAKIKSNRLYFWLRRKSK
jgi:hypothetical protein